MAEELANVSRPDESPGKKTNPWVIVAIIVVVLLCCCVILVLVIPVILTLLGPSVGNVFSNIIQEIGTPMP
jgi:small neutral amino acid transporter SnatA (MarC family)